MKLHVLFFSFLFLCCCSAGFSNPGDTTIITAHTDLPMDFGQPHDYDSLVTLPDSSKTYRKILLEFSVGKYDCGENYDPTRPGEDAGAGQTGWCADWDYDMMVYAKTASDTFELGRVITPYGNSTMTRTPANWKHPYYFDVTDLYPVLQGDVTLAIRYNAWHSGWTGSVRLLFIEGTPPRNVVKVSSLWTGTYAYGEAGNPIDNQVTAITEQFPTDAVSAAFRLFITGHGADDPEGCAEFCNKWYQFKINGTTEITKDIWRDDCGDNFLYPQSGTWVFNRANWCPGDLVRLIQHDIPASVTAGSNYDIDLDFEPYTHTAGTAMYKLGAAVVYYGDFNKSLDAGIEDIISPSNKKTHFRSNPICGSPEIVVNNFGSTAITSINFEYGVEGQPFATYTHTTQLNALESQHVFLPALEAIDMASGPANQFTVRILSINGATDQDPYNDEMSSTFEPVPIWAGGQLAVKLKTSSLDQWGRPNPASWKITDLAGNVVAERDGSAVNTLYEDTLHLENGCYKLELDCSQLGIGLRNPYFLTSAGSGYLRVFDLQNGDRISIPAHDIGPISAYQGPQAGWVGNGFVSYFRVTNSLDINDVGTPGFQFDIYPNPVHSELTLELRNLPNLEPARITLVNALGQMVYQTEASESKSVISVAHLPAGVYFISCHSKSGVLVKKVVINR